MGRKFSTTTPASHPVCPAPLSFTSFTSSISFTSYCLRTLWHAPKLNSFPFNGFRTLCRKTPGVGGRIAMLNSPSRAKWPPSLRGNSSFVFFTTDNCSRTTARFPVLLGLRRRIRGRFSRTFGPGDRGEGLHVESFVVRIPRHYAALESLHKQEPRSKVRFHV